ncbi:MAG: proline--tRNA ligase [Oscillospiraceae bacterium]|jgi:prolyl-tRNA synthetase|nr:proline--tRNA ligase [Oscillospiraceae bacterium]
MKMSQLAGQRFKETPAECQIASHILMTRGGYIKNVGSGIFSLFTPAKRITQKIEAIIREEMDAIGGQEVMFPVAMPASLWKESGRFDSVGSELLRFKDRGGSDMVLGMTHEEAAVHLVRDAAPSYANYPFMIYQIQTKFRDEPRARGGLIRVREFTMKDAYSFHASQEDLERYYALCYRAYERIFIRAGLPDFIAVQSDSGMMGGKVAHEFMLLADAGEDTLALCEHCGFSANIDVAECIVRTSDTADEPLELISTPGTKTIGALCERLSVTPDKTCKAVMYRKDASDGLVAVFIRGDLDVNEIKLRNYLKEEIHPDTAHEDDVAYGFCGPVNFTAGALLLFDRSLRDARGMVTGANKADFHYKGFSPGRDCPDVEYHDFAKTCEGAVCPSCGKQSVIIRKGIEVGNIFQLGTKYTAAMGMRYIDKDGAARHPVMGCYGIGVGRLMASICEARHDAFGPVWPMPVAPWQAHICALRAGEGDVRSTADALYDALLKSGVEVLYDDRPVSAGVMFSDADLLGVPLRVVISPKTAGRGVVEVVKRDKSLSLDVAAGEAVPFIRGLIQELLGEFTPA